jgi:hypothetical protein
MMETIATRRADTFWNGASSITGKIDSVTSDPHDRMRDSHSVMYGRIQTANHVHIRSWCNT